MKRKTRQLLVTEFGDRGDQLTRKEKSKEGVKKSDQIKCHLTFTNYSHVLAYPYQAMPDLTTYLVETYDWYRIVSDPMAEATIKRPHWRLQVVHGCGPSVLIAWLRRLQGARMAKMEWLHPISARLKAS